jgi:hypothetical protein
MATDDELVFAIDLTHEALREVGEELATAHDRSSERPLPPLPHRPIRQIALLLADRDEPLLLPIAPTRDVRLLDALARLIRVAVVLGLRVSEIAQRYGTPYEQKLVSERRLPGWALGSIASDTARLLPEDVRRALCSS